jgi:cytochrome P450
MSSSVSDRTFDQYDVRCPAAANDRERFWKQMREEQPVRYNPDIKLWTVTRHDDVRFVVQSPTLFGKPPVGPVGELTPEVREVIHDYLTEFVPTFESNPPEHSFFKRIVRAPLTPPRVAPRRDVIADIANDLIDEFIDESKVDLVDRFAFPLPAIHTYRYIGVPDDDLADIRRESTAQVTLYMSFPPEEEQMELAVLTARYWDRLKALVDDHIENPRDDIVSDLLDGRSDEDGRALTRIEVASILRGLVIGAHDTSTSLIANTMNALLSVPERWERVLANPELAEAAVNESLRFHTPAVGHYYVAFEDVEIGGQAIKKGEYVYPCYFAANHDPSQYDDPDAWNMDREDNTRNLTFGGGIHLCPGTALGRLTGTTAVRTLAERIPDLRLADEGAVQGTRFTNYGLQSLMVTWR